MPFVACGLRIKAIMNRKTDEGVCVALLSKVNWRAIRYVAGLYRANAILDIHT